MGDKYRIGDIVVIVEDAVGSVLPNEIGIISDIDFFISESYPYTVCSISNNKRKDIYGIDEMRHLF